MTSSGTSALHEKVVVRSLWETFQPFCCLKQNCQFNKTFDSQRSPKMPGSGSLVVWLLSYCHCLPSVPAIQNKRGMWPLHSGGRSQAHIHISSQYCPYWSLLYVIKLWAVPCICFVFHSKNYSLPDCRQIKLSVSLTVAPGKVPFFYETYWNPVAGRDCTTQNANVVVCARHPMNMEICPPLKAGHKVKGSVFVSRTTIAC